MEDHIVEQVAFTNLCNTTCALTHKETSDAVVMHKDLSDGWPPSLQDMRDDRVANWLIVDRQARERYYQKIKRLGVVLALSGGLDSTTVLHWCLDLFGRVHCLLFDYSQRHAIELDHAKAYLKTLLGKEEYQGRIKYTVVDMSPINALASSALTREGIAVPADRNIEDMTKDIPITFVPGRNVYFTTALAQVAYAEGWRHIALGVNVLDYSVGGGSLIYLRDNNGTIQCRQIQDIADDWQGKCTASVNLATNKVEWKPVLDWFKHDVSKNKKYRITLERGQQIDVTDGHSLFTIDEESTYLKEVTGSQIEVGMPLAVPTTCAVDVPDAELEALDLSELPDYIDGSTSKKMIKVDDGFIYFRDKSLPLDYPVTDEFLRLVGLWLAEGGKEHTNKDNTLAFSIGAIPKCAKLFREYFTARGYRIQEASNGFDMSVTSKLYASMFKYLGLFGTAKKGDKEFPPFYWRLSQRQRRIVIAALYDGDGCKSTRYSIDLYQKSRAIIDGIYQTFLIDGIFPRLATAKHNQKSIKITCAKDAGKFIMHYPMWHYEKVTSYAIMAVSKGKDKVRGFWKCQGVWDKVSNTVLGVGDKTEVYCRGGKYDQSFRAQRSAIACVPELKHLVDTDIAMVRVISVEVIDDNYMYDLSVEGNQNFIANGVLAHNSGYPDCRPEFMDAMRTALRIGIFNNKDVGVHAPLMQLNKKQIIRLGQHLGVDYALTHSCYEGVQGGCGTCDSCVLRRQAFTDLGQVDPAIVS